MAFCAKCGADKRTLNVCPSCGSGPEGTGSVFTPPVAQQPQYQTPAYQQPTYQQPQYQQPMQSQKTNGFAIASFVCSLLCISLLGIIFGHVGMSQINRNREGGRGLAIAGLILGYIGLVVTIAVYVLVFAAASAEY
jgi:peptidyl-prolyl cis-trans isomerase B (cyclophilin B)